MSIQFWLVELTNEGTLYQICKEIGLVHRHDGHIRLCLKDAIVKQEVECLNATREEREPD